MFIEIKAQLFFTIIILLLFRNINTNVAKLFQRNTEDLMQDICDELFHEDSSSEENQQWEELCEEWNKPRENQQHSDIKSEDIRDEPHSSSRSISSRILSSIGRDGSSSIHTSSENRLPSSDIRHHSTRTGVSIIHPDGWLWTRSRKDFLPISEHYQYRSHSSNHRRTKSATDVESYYCTLDSDASMEIKCSTIHGDKQCCEDETSHGVFCCGGKISDDFADKLN